MRFLHTADWQIGMKAVHVGAMAQRVRDERLAAAKRVVQAARDHQADFLVLAGDTFEDNAVGPLLVQRVADILAQFPGRVYLLPGNHDPLVPGSVWHHPAWDGHTNLHVLRTTTPLPIAGGTLYPSPCFDKHSQGDPTHNLNAHSINTPATNGQSDKAIAIGIAHGTVEGVAQDEPDYPIARNAPTRAGLDYLAIGHWHSTVLYVDDHGAPRMAYSGTHEPTKFGERESGHTLLVEIESRGAAPIIKQIATGGLKWHIYDEEIRELSQLTELSRWVEQLSNPENILVDFRLSGLLPAEGWSELKRLETVTEARLFYSRWDTTGLRPLPNDEAWLLRLPAGPLRHTAERLRQWADPTFTGTRPDDAQPEQAARALMELYHTTQGHVTHEHTQESTAEGHTTQRRVSQTQFAAVAENRA